MQLSDRIGSRMKLQDLHVLMTVVQAGSMGKAAQLLGTTQPNVSRSIRDLEQALGVRLLERHRQGAAPTEYGRALLDCGVAALDNLRQGVKAIALLGDPTAGEVRIGTTAFLAGSFVTALVDRLSRSYPRIVFHIVTGYIETLETALSERRVDLLIVRSPHEISDERLNFEFLFDDSYVVVAGRQHPWARRRRINMAALVDALWVLPPPTSVIGAVVREAFHANGLDYPPVAVVTDAPHMRTALLATGRFITVFPASALRFIAPRAEFKVLPVQLPKARRPNGIVTLKQRALSPVAQHFIAAARELAAPLVKAKG